MHEFNVASIISTFHFFFEFESFDGIASSNFIDSIQTLKEYVLMNKVLP